MLFFHGSHSFLPDATVLTAKNEYVNSSDGISELEALFEIERPNTIKHKRTNCVFMVQSIDDIDNAGGYLEFIYEVEATEHEKSDIAWYTKAWIQYGENNIEGAKESARKYWSGEVFEDLDQSVFEFRTNEAFIIKSIP